MARGRAVETSPLIFVFRMTYYVHRGSGQARVFSMYSWAAEPKHPYFKGGIDVSSATLYSMRALAVVGDTAEEVVSPSAISTEFDATYNYIPLCIVCIYCCTAVCTC